MESDRNVLSAEYQLRWARIGEYRNRVWQVLCDGYFGKLIPADSCVLDLGCGWGEFINNIKARKKLALDLNPDSRKWLHDQVQFINQDCSEPWPVEPESVDAVFTSNFLEHIASKDRVVRCLAEAHRALKVDGLIICVGPNIKYVPGAYWDFWDHSIPLTEMSVSEILRLGGFSIETCIPRFLPFSMSTGIRPPTMLVRLYLRLPLVWPVLGRQFLVVARKDRRPDGLRP